MIRTNAFRHRWIELPNEQRLAELCVTGLSADDRLAKYMCVLQYASEFVRENTHIRNGLAAAAQRAPEVTAMPISFETYEAVAFEWLVLGLVELPPSGVEVVSGSG